MRQTHARRKVPASYAARDELPRITPIIGDTICYETWAGDPIHREDALRRMRDGRTVYYTTWEKE